MVKVLVSEWSRRAAHNLDMKRDEWVAVTSPSDFAEVELQEIKVDKRLDHSSVLLGSYSDMISLYTKVVSDIHVLQGYISEMNRTKLVDGKRYPKRTFDTFKLRLVKELAYKQLLATILREASRQKRMFAHDETSEYDGSGFNNLSSDELLVLVNDMFRRNMRAMASGEDWYSKLPDSDKALAEYLQRRIRKYRLRVSHTLTNP